MDLFLGYDSDEKHIEDAHDISDQFGHPKQQNVEDQLPVDRLWTEPSGNLSDFLCDEKNTVSD